MRQILAVLAALAVATPALAQSQSKQCDRQARQETGYWGNRIPDVNLGPVRLSIGGSVSFGLSNSSGPALPKSPRGAGAYAREQREEAARDRYEAAYARCMS